MLVHPYRPPILSSCISRFVQIKFLFASAVFSSLSSKSFTQSRSKSKNCFRLSVEKAQSIP